MSLKSSLKTTIAKAWDSASRMRSAPPKLTILYYHAVRGDQAAAFDAQMAHLRKVANVVRPDHTGSLDSHRPNVAVTFDDAFRSVRQNALPALARHQIPATIFVPTGWLGRAPGWQMETASDRDEVVMSAEELRSLPRDLISFGSHTVNHPRLTRLAEPEVAREFAESRASLEGLFGQPIDTLAFPYGDHDARVVAQAEAAGFRHAYTVAPEAIREGDNKVLRGRTSADPGDPPGLFALKTRGAFDWMPLASRLKRAIKR